MLCDRATRRLPETPVSVWTVATCLGTRGAHEAARCVWVRTCLISARLGGVALPGLHSATEASEQWPQTLWAADGAGATAVRSALCTAGAGSWHRGFCLGAQAPASLKSVLVHWTVRAGACWGLPQGQGQATVAPQSPAQPLCWPFALAQPVQRVPFRLSALTLRGGLACFRSCF